MIFVDLLFPKRCIGCGLWGTYLCDACASSIPLSVPRCIYCHKLSPFGKTHQHCITHYGIHGVYGFYSYCGVIQKVIKVIKYRFAYAVISALLQSIRESLITKFKQVIGSDLYIVVPIPLHPKRLRWRGFNQAEIIAKIIADRLSYPIHTSLLRKIKETVPQADIQKRSKRIENTRDIFVIQKQFITYVKGKSFILVDDVSTTGATLLEACKELKIAGAKRVWGLTVAQ